MRNKRPDKKRKPTKHRPAKTEIEEEDRELIPMPSCVRNDRRQKVRAEENEAEDEEGEE